MTGSVKDFAGILFGLLCISLMVERCDYNDARKEWLRECRKTEQLLECKP